MKLHLLWTVVVLGTVGSAKRDDGTANPGCTANTTCPSTLVTPPNQHACLCVEGDLIVQGVKSDEEVRHLWGIQKTANGRIHIHSTDLKLINFGALSAVDHTSKSAAVLIEKNSKLEKVVLGKVFFTATERDSSRTRRVVIVNNGKYRMPRRQYSDLMDPWRSPEQQYYLIDVDETTKIVGRSVYASEDFLKKFLPISLFVPFSMMVLSTVILVLWLRRVIK